MPRRFEVGNSPNGEEMRGDYYYVVTSGVDHEAISLELRKWLPFMLAIVRLANLTYD